MVLKELWNWWSLNKPFNGWTCSMFLTEQFIKVEFNRKNIPLSSLFSNKCFPLYNRNFILAEFEIKTRLFGLKVHKGEKLLDLNFLIFPKPILKNHSIKTNSKIIPYRMLHHKLDIYISDYESWCDSLEDLELGTGCGK